MALAVDDASAVTRAGVSRAGVNRVGVNRVGVNRVGVNRVGINRAESDMAVPASDMAVPDWVSLRPAWRSAQRRPIMAAKARTAVLPMLQARIPLPAGMARPVTQPALCIGPVSFPLVTTVRSATRGSTSFASDLANKPMISEGGNRKRSQPASTRDGFPPRVRIKPATLGVVRRSGDAVSKLDWAGDVAERLEAFAGAKDVHVAIVEHAPED